MVCNAGPIIALAKIDQLLLLHRIAKSVFIPETVLYEVLAKPGLDADRIIHASRTWMKIAKPPEKVAPSVELAVRKLDSGEAQVVRLASSLTGSVVALLDDAAGRKAARRVGISVVGFAGILILSKQRDLIPLVHILLDEARNKGYWLSDDILLSAKKLAGE